MGKLAPFAMLGIVLLAYGIGGIIRYNIRNLEPLLQQSGKMDHFTLYNERVSSFALSLAYVVSIAFYLRLLSSFLLHQTGHGGGVFLEKGLTTFVLLSIGLVGVRFGLRVLEHLEKYSVTIKLAIIFALLIGLALFDLRSIPFESLSNPAAMEHGWWERLRMLAGLLLVVQGFETSRYLGEEYDRDTRNRTMRLAQVLSGAIYVAFVILALPLLAHMQNPEPDETAIIELAGMVSPLLPYMLIVAAVMSQFSAAVADTVGCGGLLSEETKGKLTAGRSYLLITGLAIVLVWVANVFEIISIASRAFALYYLLQGINAWMTVGKCEKGGTCAVQRLRFGVLILALAFVVIFGISAE